MTVTVNVHYNLAAWSSGTFTLAQRCSSSGNAYQCIVPGSSTFAPTGTGSNINNGGVAVFKWLSAIDYTNLNAWISAWPSPLVDNMVALLWNNGAITTSLGASFFTISNHSMGSFTATVTTAPGEGIKDTLIGGVTPLAFNATAGVGFICPSSGAGDVVYIYIDCPNIIIDGLQFQDTNSGSASNFLGFDSNASNWIFRNCILDAYAQSGSPQLSSTLAGEGVSATVYNNVFIDRQASGSAFSFVAIEAAAENIINNTFFNPNNNTAGFAFDCTSGSRNVTVRNCAFIGYSSPIISDGTATHQANTDHCVFSASTLNTTYIVNNGNNLLSKTGSNQFVNAGSDFRLKRGADCLNAAAVDTTDIPTATDIAGHYRGTTGSWDAGAWEMTPLPMGFEAQLHPPSLRPPRALGGSPT